ncbi:MAG: hypothetical protein U0992_11015 [Planctomycetaceae bacterium]
MIGRPHDQRSPARKKLDEQIAGEPPLSPPDLPADAIPKPLEAHLAMRRRPIAIAGIVENGVVRPEDPTVRLPEHSRVIIVVAE